MKKPSIAVVGTEINAAELDKLVSVEPIGVELDNEKLINAAAFEADADWVLLLGEREVVTPELAGEIVRRTTGTASAWGFRIPIVPALGDELLRLASWRGRQEVRLYHKRHAKLADGVVRPKGTVTRIAMPIRHVLYQDARHQMADYESRGVPHSLPRRITLFILWSLQERALFSPVTLGYLWRRAAWDLSGTTLRSDES